MKVIEYLMPFIKGTFKINGMLVISKKYRKIWNIVIVILISILIYRCILVPFYILWDKIIFNLNLLLRGV